MTEFSFPSPGQIPRGDGLSLMQNLNIRVLKITSFIPVFPLNMFLMFSPSYQISFFLVKCIFYWLSLWHKRRAKVSVIIIIRFLLVNAKGNWKFFVKPAHVKQNVVISCAFLTSPFGCARRLSDAAEAPSSLPQYCAWHLCSGSLLPQCFCSLDFSSHGVRFNWFGILFFSMKSNKISVLPRMEKWESVS